MISIVIVIVILILLIVIFGAVLYNGLVSLNQRVSEAWSDITVQLKRRADLIPNLVSTVKGYAQHESSVFMNVTNARAHTLEAKGPVEAAKAENQIQQTLKSLFAVAENYPDLKANQGFLDLQAELTDTEDKIQASRRFYNNEVRDFNTKRKTFPTNMFAAKLGFNSDKEYFELDETENSNVQEPVQVKF